MNMNYKNQKEKNYLKHKFWQALDEHEVTSPIHTEIVRIALKELLKELEDIEKDAWN